MNTPAGDFPTHQMIRASATYEILSTDPNLTNPQLVINVGDHPANDGRVAITIQTPSGDQSILIEDTGGTNPESHLFFTNVVFEALNMALNDISLPPQGEGATGGISGP